MDVADIASTSPWGCFVIVLGIAAFLLFSGVKQCACDDPRIERAPATVERSSKVKAAGKVLRYIGERMEER